MFRTYRDVFIWLYVILWFIITIAACFITGNYFVSVCIINPIMIVILIIIRQIILHNKKIDDWLETPIKKD